MMDINTVDDISEERDVACHVLCAVTAQSHSFSGHNNSPNVTSVSR